jgi:hypothetical protein
MAHFNTIAMAASLTDVSLRKNVQLMKNEESNKVKKQVERYRSN